MTKNNWQELYQQAKSWTIEAGQNLKNTLEDGFLVEYKTSVADLVTEKDRETEAFFVHKIQEKYPDHYILGEEGVSSKQDYNPLEEIVWIIDPIDGTSNFVHQKQNFAISIGICVKGVPMIGIIYDPIREECYHALKGEGAYLNDTKLVPLSPTNIEESLVGISSLWVTPNSIFDHLALQKLVKKVRGTRSIGSSALELASVATGRLDSYLTLRLAPWDFAGGLIILEELGAKISTIENKPVDYFQKSTLLVAKPGLHEQIIALIENGEKEE